MPAVLYLIPCEFEIKREYTVAIFVHIHSIYRLFFHAEKVNIDAKCAALDEHLPEAIHCYNQAIKGYTKEGTSCHTVFFVFLFLPILKGPNLPIVWVGV